MSVMCVAVKFKNVVMRAYVTNRQWMEQRARKDKKLYNSLRGTNQSMKQAYHAIIIVI